MQIALVLSPLLASRRGANILTNGDFSNGLTGWTNGSVGTGTVTVTDGAAVFVATNASNRGILTRAVTVVSGVRYQMTFTAAVIATNGISMGLTGAATSSADYVGAASIYFTTTTATLNLTVQVSNLNGSASIDDIQIRQVY